jgi:hypothetical protein
MLQTWAFVGSILVLALGLPIFSYLALIYRELGRMSTGRVHEHLEIFEAEIEPKLKINRRSGGRTFRILGHFWLAFVVLETTRAVVYLVPSRWEAGVQFLVFAEAFVAANPIRDGAGLAGPCFSGGCGIAGADFGAGCGADARAARGRGN